MRPPKAPVATRGDGASALHDIPSGERERRDDIFRYFRLDLAADDADAHWRRIVARHEQLIQRACIEIDIRATAFDYFLRRRLIVDPVVVERESFQETELLAYHDRLTGLQNYAHFDAEIRLEVARALRYQSSVALVLLDVDAFKGINDRLGHSVGNDVLVDVARLLRQDLRTGDLVARIGGDEFALLLHRADLKTGALVAVRKREAIERRFRAPSSLDTELPVTASFGVAAVPTQARSVRALFEAADAALYHAKRNGRNRISFARGDRLVCLESPTLERRARWPRRGVESEAQVGSVKGSRVAPSARVLFKTGSS